MERTFARRFLMSSLVVAGAAGGLSACSNTIPTLPPDPNPIQVSSKAPPPVSGGTLLVKDDLAVAADSDRDLVWLVDLTSNNVRKVALQEGDEPGRVVIDGDGHAEVALRRAGAIATIDIASGKVLSRTPVCSAPRGLAYDAANDQVHVACAGGELVTLENGAVFRTLHLDRDLRDVIVQGDHLLVSRFRDAQLLVIDAEGNVLNRQAPPQFMGFSTTFSPTVAWRTVGMADGSSVMVHQRAADGSVVISKPDGYGGGDDPCGDGTIVATTVTGFDANGNPQNGGQAAPTIIGATVPVDIAGDGTGNFAVVSAGTDTIFLTSTFTIAQTGFVCGGSEGEMTPDGQPVAVASHKGQWVVQTREPAGLVLMDGSGQSRIDFGAESVADTGHYLFHHAASGSTHLACASCHPEGADDAHTWHFDTIGARRTQTVGGGVLDTAPLHWNGDMNDLSSIMHEVFENRMGGSPQGPRHIAAFADWIQSVPALPASPRGTKTQIDHGQEIFNRADVGCADCHSGAHLTNNRNTDVGTGFAFQVPTLVGIAGRAPFMHDGCAPTLHDRFDPTKAACNGGDKHGKTSQLSASEIDDLVAYLESL